MATVGPPILREEIKDFADAMELVLRKHDKEKGDSWKDMSPFDLLYILEKEYLELDGEWVEGDKERMRAELIDVANIAMMIWHRLK
jgi:hypothetical protein